MRAERDDSKLGRGLRGLDTARMECGRPTIDLAARGGRRRRRSALVAGLLVLGLASVGFAEQAPDGATSKAAPERDMVGDVGAAMSLRYRFSEKYAVEDDPVKPWLVSQYQVATVMTQKLVVEKQQGTPDRSEQTLRMRFTERSAKVNNLGDVTDTLRRYDTFRLKSAGTSTLQIPEGMFQGLTIWYRIPSGGKPAVVMTVDDKRALRADEYHEIVTKHVFFPGFKAVLPVGAMRVGDHWNLSRAAETRLVGPLPDDDEANLEGTLLEVKKSPAGLGMVAIFGIAGEVSAGKIPRAVNARIHFEFMPAGAGAAAANGENAAGNENVKKPAGAGAAVVEARGWINEVRLGEAQTLEFREGSRLRQIITRELVMARRPFTPRPGQVSGSEAPLIVPDPGPSPDEQNSWLLYDDPKGRFHFRHPQELQPPAELIVPSGIELVTEHPGGLADAISVTFEGKDHNPEPGRQSRDPDYYRRAEKKLWEESGQEVLPGPMGWLPDADWGPLKRKVYRLETALVPDVKVKGAVSRIYRDFYLVLFTTGEVVTVTAMTSQDTHVAFRDRVESMIKSFTLGKPRAVSGAAAPTNAPPTGAPRATSPRMPR